MAEKKKKKKLKVAIKEKSKDTQATTEVKKKVKKPKPEPKQEPELEIVKPEAKKGELKKKPIKDTSDKLPDVIKQRKIICKDVGGVVPTKVALEDITATSKCIYVNDIHSANPEILQTIYWIIMPNTVHVLARVTKEEYEYVVQKTGKQGKHLVSVVDCSVIPTLTYGSWKLKDIKGELPTTSQIEEEDENFRKNPTNFHNVPVKIEIYENELKALDEVAAADETDDEEFEIEDESEDESVELIEDDDEEFLFDED